MHVCGGEYHASMYVCNGEHNSSMHVCGVSTMHLYVCVCMCGGGVIFKRVQNVRYKVNRPTQARGENLDQAGTFGLSGNFWVPWLQSAWEGKPETSSRASSSLHK